MSSGLASEQESASYYTLTVKVVKATLTNTIPNPLHVVAFVDGKEVYSTSIAKGCCSMVWNETFEVGFDSLEPVTPILLTLSLYKKRFTGSGTKIVGSVQMSVSDIGRILNKGVFEQEFDLAMCRKSCPAWVHGKLLLALRLEDKIHRQDNLKASRSISTVVCTDIPAIKAGSVKGEFLGDNESDDITEYNKANKEFGKDYSKIFSITPDIAMLFNAYVKNLTIRTQILSLEEYLIIFLCLTLLLMIYTTVEQSRVQTGLGSMDDKLQSLLTRFSNLTKQWRSHSRTSVSSHQ